MFSSTSRPARRALPVSSPRVAALVAEEAIVVVEHPRTGRDDEHRRRAGTQHAAELGQGALIVRDVLEQVCADRRIHARVGQRQRARVGLHEARVGDIHVCLAQACPDEVDSHQRGARIPRANLLEEVSGGASEIDHDAARLREPKWASMARRVHTSMK